MPPETDIHMDVAAYLLGSLTEREQRRFESHLQGCESCRREAAELRATADAFDAAREVRDAAAPPGMADRVMSAVAAAAAADEGGTPASDDRPSAEDAPPQRSRSRSPSRAPLVQRLIGSPAGALAAAGCAAGAIFLATALLFLGDGDDSGPDGKLEIAGTMVATEGEGSGEVDVRELGIGREIDFNSDDLPILPTGEYYELWFVGPGDSRESPNRISAGTFHPDLEGRSEVTFTAAVDPSKYPVLSVTAEPGDGDPRVNGPEVLRLDSRD